MDILERVIARLVAACLALAVAGVGLATAFGFLVAGSYMLLAIDLPSWAAALIVAGVLLVLAPLAALLILRSGRDSPRPTDKVRTAGPGRAGAGPDDMAASMAMLDRAMRKSPWSLLAAAMAAGVMLGMSREARRSVADLLAAFLRPPPR